jgi:DNA repair protein RadC
LSDEPPDHLGHRKRLRQRFLAGGSAALADYELLELLLCQAQPRGDMKPLAKALIREFGDFPAVLAAKPDELQRLPGMGEASIVALKTVEAAALLMQRAALLERPVIGSWKKLIEYCHSAMAHAKVEQFRLLFLDNRNALIADEAQQTGTINHTPVYPREVVKRALELHASAIIMLHNHASTPRTARQNTFNINLLCAVPDKDEAHRYRIGTSRRDFGSCRRDPIGARVPVI